MKSNFYFLEADFPVLAQFGQKAEAYLYSDSNSCLMKLGMIGETIVNLMFTYDRITLPVENTAVNRITTLFREGLLTQDLVDILHALRKTRNKAVHDNYASVSDGKTLLQMAHGLCEWFMQTYGDWNYKNQPFVMPAEEIAVLVTDKKKEKETEEQLSKQAEAVAAAAPTVVASERKKQANKAASQRQKSEAETRYMIDEQLRQVGWEANTEEIRYSKGSRPAKGHNMAIAEWPTDSTVGKKGYADYALFVGLQLVAIIEAKAEHKDIPSVLDYQGKEYPRNIRAEDAKYQIGTWGEYKVPFTFATNGRPYLEQYKTKSGIWFLDLRQSDNVPKALHGWISPDGIMEMLEKDIQAGNQALQDLSYDLLRDKDGLNLRDYQVKAIQAAEKAVMEGKRTALLAMATGTGKTRTVLEEISRSIDPENPKESGKTLIFAVNDDHADMIVDILKNIYAETGVDSNAVMKITGKAGGGDPKKIQEAIKRFKNEDYPSVVVTVDLLTTGIDVPEINTLVFMRRIKSRILFEQMLGRATRLCPKIKKTHFEIHDPVGVYDSLEPVNTMKPVVANPTATFGQLLEGLKTVEDEKQVENQINQIIAKLQRKKRNLDSTTLEHFASMTGGMTPEQFIADIKKRPAADARNRLLANEALFALLQAHKPNGGKPVVISNEEDELISHTRGYGKNDQRPEDYLDAFSQYVTTNMNEIAALKIICTRPKDLTRSSLKNLKLALDREGFTTQQLNTAISELTNEEMAADIISLIRRYAIGSALISHEARIRRAVDKLKKAHKFTKQELSWIVRMEKYLMEESVLNVGVFDEDSRFKTNGGFAKINKVFANKLESIVLELNEYLYDDTSA